MSGSITDRSQQLQSLLVNLKSRPVRTDMKFVDAIRNLLSIICNSLGTFLRNCNLHGVRYIAGTDRRMFERVLWLLLVFGAFAFMAQLSFRYWLKFSQSVTVTTIDSTSYPVSEVFFPSVSICTNSKFTEDLDHIVYHMVNNLNVEENSSREFIDKMKFLIRPFKIDMKNVKEIEASLLRSGITADHIIRSTTKPCKLLLKRCQLGGRARSCERLFRLITTGKGFCCAFNYFADRRDDLAEVLAENAAQHLALSGYENGLLVMVNTGDPEEDQFAEVMIGHPFEFLDVSTRTCRVGSNEELTVAVRPTTVHSTDAVRGLEIQRRQCVFEDEIELKSSTIYSYSTCVTQCRMDQIFRFCRCVPFFYLHDDLVRTLRPQNGSGGCKCLPRCTDSWYDTDCALSKLAHHDYTTSSFMHRTNRSKIGIISVAWADTLSILYTRDVSLTWDTFLGIFGGILSLCVGGSVLSVVELFYFMLIRTCTDSQVRPTRRPPSTKKAPSRPRQPTLQLFWAEFTQNLVARSKK